MKKNLKDFTMFEAKNLIVPLLVEIRKLIKSKDVVDLIKHFETCRKNAKENNGGETMKYTDFVFDALDLLLVAHEESLWRILAAITQNSVAEVKEMNNVEVMELMTDFFSIPIYKQLLSRGIKSDMKKQ